MEDEEQHMPTREEAEVGTESSANNHDAAGETDAFMEVGGIRSAPPDVVKQPKGECDPESLLPCQYPSRNVTELPDTIPMPATESNIPALESRIKNHFKSSVFNKCRTDDNVYIGKQEYNEVYAHIIEEAHTDKDEEGVEAVENDKGGGVQVPVTGETHDDHDGVADEAEDIGGGASKEMLEKEEIPPDNENPPDIKPTVDIDSQEHIESAERFGADSRQQICLRSMMLPREERSSNFVKKFARKFAASPTTVICEHTPMMEHELTDNLVGMGGTKASKEDTPSPRKTSLEGQGQPEQWPPPTGRRGCQAMKSPRQSPPTRSHPLARSIKTVNDERVHDRALRWSLQMVRQELYKSKTKVGE
jgi:hypothetical protein